MKHFIKKILSLLLVFLITFSALSITKIKISANEWAGYTAISTKAELNAVRDNLSGKYYLTRDIVFTEEDFKSGGAFYNDDAGWLPIGSVFQSVFTGIFNGNGFEIQGLEIRENSTSSYLGLFGISSGVICNVGLVGSSVSSSASSSCAGGIAGDNSSGTIENCYNTGFVSSSTSDSSYAGGITGYNSGTITNCYNTGFVSSSTSNSSYAGGITGYNNYSTIENCYNTGSVSSSSTSYSYAGGIAGNNSSSISTITNCYNTGSVSSSSASNSSYAGGITSHNNGTIKNCYNTGPVSSSSTSTKASYAGGIAGNNSSSISTIENCYNIGSVSSSSTSNSSYAGGIAGYNNGIIKNCYYLDIILKGIDGNIDMTTKCTSEQMKLQSTFTGFDFEDIWYFCEDCIEHTYPLLSSLSHPKYIIDITVTALPDKTEYIEGNNFSTIGMEGIAYYNDDSSELITDWISPTTPLILGQTEIVVSYKGKTATVNINTVAKSLSEIKVTTKPTKLTYLEGDAVLDITDMIVTAYYNNGTSAIIAPDSVTGYTSTPGDKTIVVTYQGKSDTFTVTVNAKSLTSIAVTIKPAKLIYLEGDAVLDTTDMIVTAYYNNGTTAIVAPDSVTGYGSTPGDKTITVNYQGQIDTFIVTVNAKSLTSIAVTTKPTKLIYLEGDAVLDTTDMIVTAYYNNNTNEVITPDSVTGYTSTPSDKTIVVTYQGQIDTFIVTVNAKALTSIAVTTKPTKLIYLEGDTTILTDGMIVTAYYNNGTNAIIAPDSVTGYTSTPSDKTITVNYQGQTDTFTVVVEAKTVSYVEIIGELEKAATFTIIVEEVMPSIIKGDTNDDGVVDIRDAIEIFRYLAGKTTLEGNAGDIDADGDVSIKDAIYIFRYLADKLTYDELQELQFTV